MLEITYYPQKGFRGFAGTLEVKLDAVTPIVKHGASDAVEARRIASDYEALYGVKAVFRTEAVKAPRAVDVEQKGLVSRSAPKRAVVGGRSVSID